MDQMSYYKDTLGNFVEFLCQTSKNTEAALKESEGCVWVNTLSQYPLFNGYFNFTNNKKAINTVIKEAKGYFGDVPFTLWQYLDASEHLEDLEKMLQQSGFHSAGKYSGILLDLNEFKPNTKRSDLVVVKTVLTEQDFDHYCVILNEVFQLAGSIAEEFRQLLNPSRKDAPYINYVAYYKGQPAAILTSFISDKTVGVYCGGTLPAFRKQGVFTHLLEGALEDTKERGCERSVAQLMAKNMAGGVATKLGYKTVCHFIPYVYGADANSLEA